MYPLCEKDIERFVLLCESGDRVMVDQSSFSADLHAVMLRHHCSEYDTDYRYLTTVCFKPNHVSVYQYPFS